MEQPNNFAEKMRFMVILWSQSTSTTEQRGVLARFHLVPASDRLPPDRKSVV